MSYGKPLPGFSRRWTMSGPNVFRAVTGVRTKTILSTIIKTLPHNLSAPAWLASSSGQGLTESVRTWAEVPRGQSPLPSLNVCHSHVTLLFISSKLVSGAWTLTASTWHSTVTPPHIYCCTVWELYNLNIYLQSFNPVHSQASLQIPGSTMAGTEQLLNYFQQSLQLLRYSQDDE